MGVHRIEKKSQPFVIIFNFIQSEDMSILPGMNAAFLRSKARSNFEIESEATERSLLDQPVTTPK